MEIRKTKIQSKIGLIMSVFGLALYFFILQDSPEAKMMAYFPVVILFITIACFLVDCLSNTAFCSLNSTGIKVKDRGLLIEWDEISDYRFDIVNERLISLQFLRLLDKELKPIACLCLDGTDYKREELESFLEQKLRS